MLQDRNEINAYLQDKGAIYYEIVLPDGEKITYYTPQYNRDYIATDKRIKAGIFE